MLELLMLSIKPVINVNHIYSRLRVAGVKRSSASLCASVCDSVCLSVCLSVCSIAQKRMILKSSNLVQGMGMILGYPASAMVLGLKGQRSKSQGNNKSAKNIEGDRVAGVSLHLYRVPTVYPFSLLNVYLCLLIPN